MGNLGAPGLLRDTAFTDAELAASGGAGVGTRRGQPRTLLEWAVIDSVSQHKCRLCTDSLTTVLSNLSSKGCSLREHFKIKQKERRRKPPGSHPLAFPLPRTQVTLGTGPWGTSESLSAFLF